MTRSVTLAALSILLGGCLSHSTVPTDSASRSATRAARQGRAGAGTVFVTSQDLYFDTFVVKDPLPMKGRFQLLENGVTEFGPGDAGYLGGRWWEDTDHNGTQDATDHYFLCPLLGPGRESP